MIALIFGLPLVRCEESRAVAFECAWLKSALENAATKAGYHNWWLAEDLTECVASYLRQTYSGSVIDLVSLEQAVRSVLREVGYEEVAVRFHTPIPGHRISLVQCLREVSCNDRTAFFDGLAQHITRLQATRSTHIHFSDLQACVRGLQRLQSATWNNDNQGLLPNVVTFVREQVESVCWRQGLLCSIS